MFRSIQHLLNHLPLSLPTFLSSAAASPVSLHLGSSLIAGTTSPSSLKNGYLIPKLNVLPLKSPVLFGNILLPFVVNILMPSPCITPNVGVSKHTTSGLLLPKTHDFPLHLAFVINDPHSSSVKRLNRIPDSTRKCKRS